MSNDAPAIPLFGDAYLADTRHLSLEEHGAYLQLMMVAWRLPNCALPDDDARLARMIGVTLGRWGKLKPAVMGFWTLGPDGWKQKRLSKERAYVEEKRRKNKSAAEARWNSQPIENTQGEGCERISERNAPPPPPPQDEEVVVAKATTPRVRAPVVKGKRLSVDWLPEKPLPSSVAELCAQWPPGRFDRELEGFRDYWTSRTRDAAKLDWDKTWHNRIRDQHDRIMREHQNGRSNSNRANDIDAACRNLGFG